MARNRPPSRPKRWAAAIKASRSALTALRMAYSELEAAFSDLNDVKSEYEDWLNNMPEGLQSSALAEKLQAIVDLDLPDDPRESIYSDLWSVISEIEAVDLPLGFGRD